MKPKRVDLPPEKVDKIMKVYVEEIVGCSKFYKGTTTTVLNKMGNINSYTDW